MREIGVEAATCASCPFFAVRRAEGHREDAESTRASAWHLCLQRRGGICGLSGFIRCQPFHPGVRGSDRMRRYTSERIEHSAPDDYLLVQSAISRSLNREYGS